MHAYSIIEECNKAKIPINANNCIIEFNLSTGNVLSFGGIRKGEFEGNPDIAGVGVFRAFMVLSIFVSAMGVFLAIKYPVPNYASMVLIRPPRKPNRYLTAMEWSNTFHVVVDDVILSSADTQLLLILAFGAAYYSTAQCSISLYHYIIAYHMVLVGMLTSVLAFVLVRSPFKSFLSSLARLAIMIFCEIVMLLSLGLIESKPVKENELQANTPGNGQKDSFLILPAYCLLDSSIDPVSNLTDEQRQHLTNTGHRRDIIHQIYVIAGMLVLLVFIPLVIGFWKYTQRHVKAADAALFPNHTEDQNATAKVRFFLSSFIKGIMWGLCLGFIIWNWITIVNLRNWIDTNDWLNKEKGNPERGLEGIGQLAPLAALGAGCFTFSNGLWEIIKTKSLFKYLGGDYSNSHERLTDDSFELQPMAPQTSRV
ncbi:hypothetical protein B0O99DRAFT_594167 [Bisporella sp. PMI_857]|nr:hypothetical protein B0O99DRAFT_594167 [Bisporella sp. PMI_857]